MTLRVFTADEQLGHVDALIEACEFSRRYSRRIDTMRDTKGVVVGNECLAVLKSIAADLRGRRPEAPGIALAELARRLDRVLASKTSLGYEAGTLIGLAEELIGRWPTVRQALESFAEQTR